MLEETTTGGQWNQTLGSINFVAYSCSYILIVTSSTHNPDYFFLKNIRIGTIFLNSDLVEGTLNAKECLFIGERRLYQP